jgi:hypothetical protein
VGMSVRHIAGLLGAAALLSGAAATAHAAEAPSAQVRPVDFTVRPDNPAATPAQPKTYKFEGRRGRFGVTLDLQQPETRPGTWNDVQAGAFYRITPSIRVGGVMR